MKIQLIIIKALIIFLITDTTAQDNTISGTSELKSAVGFSLFYVDPDIDLNLSGITAEMRWNYNKKKQYFLNNQPFGTSEITLGTSNVLNGKIKANSLYIAFGRRYEFPRIYYGYGFAPFTYWIFSDKKSDPDTGYTLDTGKRIYVYYLFGIKIPIKKSLLLTFDVKYNFTIKKLYLHNPFTRHKHEDVFQFFSFNFGFKNH